jgi:hypothetical protein
VVAGRHANRDLSASIKTCEHLIGLIDTADKTRKPVKRSALLPPFVLNLGMLRQKLVCEPLEFPIAR